MFEILNIILGIHIIAYILDLVIIVGISYIFIHSLWVSVLIAIISYILMSIKNTLINKIFLS